MGPFASPADTGVEEAGDEPPPYEASNGRDFRTDPRCLFDTVVLGIFSEETNAQPQVEAHVAGEVVEAELVETAMVLAGEADGEVSKERDVESPADAVAQPGLGRVLLPALLQPLQANRDEGQHGEHVEGVDQPQPHLLERIPVPLAQGVLLESPGQQQGPHLGKPQLGVTVRPITIGFHGVKGAAIGGAAAQLQLPGRGPGQTRAEGQRQ